MGGGLIDRRGRGGEGGRGGLFGEVFILSLEEKRGENVSIKYGFTV
jgi:hypothetical protein